jgi:hypothetical protein
MNSTYISTGQRIRRIFSKIGSAILMFQKVPLHHVIAQEARFIGSSGISQLGKWSIATVSGLGIYDTVSGATQITQVSPSAGSSTVPATTGEMLAFVYQMAGADGDNSKPKSWSVSGTLPAGLAHANSTNSYTDYISGTPTESGSFVVVVVGWEDPNYSGGSKSETFTINVVQGVDTFESWSSVQFDETQLEDPLVSGATADPDDDRTTNEDEFIWGTNPLAADRFMFPSIAASAGQILLSFTADAAGGPGYSGLTRHYALEACSDLSSGVWTPVSGYSDIVATGQLVESNSVIALGSNYYRLRAWLSAN